MERYTRLYSLPENLYTQGSPVIIAAGALLLDNQTGSVMAQLKFRTVSVKDVKAVMVQIDACDITNRKVDGVAEYQYLDLGASARRDAYFGQKQAIALPVSTTRAFAPCCTRVVFSDGMVWEAPESAVWESLPKSTLLSDRFTNDLAEQYKRDTAEYAAYVPESFSGLWRCTCGALNEETEETCHICRLSRKTQTDALNEETLQQHLTAYQAAEAEKAAAEAAQKAEEAAALAAKRRKAAIVAAAACVCIAAFLLVTKVIIPNKNYNAAVALMDAGQYEEAITAFEALDGYKNSEEQITECGYLRAAASMEAGQYEEAITAFEAMDGYKDSAEQIEVCKIAIKDIAYDAAVALMNEGKYDEAAAAFETLDGYKDSVDLIESILELNKPLKAQISAEVGDYITFGTYEQDGDTANGQEDIEWLVLAKEDNKILVISKYALDCQPYNTEWAGVTWETCTLRKWLNETFIDDAFSAEEKSMILATTVTADRNSGFGTDPDNNTTDQIFLLSIAEANEYFNSNDERMCAPTAYAKAQGPYTNDSYKVDGEATCWWWLRSPGYDQLRAARVSHVGGVSFYGRDVDYDYECVRPAFWINLES